MLLQAARLSVWHTNSLPTQPDTANDLLGCSFLVVFTPQLLQFRLGGLQRWEEEEEGEPWGWGLAPHGQQPLPWPPYLHGAL